MGTKKFTMSDITGAMLQGHKIRCTSWGEGYYITFIKGVWLHREGARATVNFERPDLWGLYQEPTTVTKTFYRCRYVAESADGNYSVYVSNWEDDKARFAEDYEIVKYKGERFETCDFEIAGVL